MADEKKKRTPRDILRMVFRRRLMFVLAVAVFAIAALVGAQYMPLKYTGTTVFHRHTDPAAEERAGSFESIKLTLEHELSGREAVKEASEELGLTRGFERGADGTLTLNGEMAMRTLVEGVMKNIQVRWTVRSRQVDLVSVSFTRDEPDLAQSMPNTLVRNYIAKVHDKIIDQLKKSRDFLQERVSEVDTRLGLALKRRVEFETQHAGKLPNDPGVFDQEMRAINADIDTVRRQQEVAVQQRDRLKKIAEGAEANPDAPSQVVKGPNPRLAELKKELDAKKEELKGFEDAVDTAVTLSHMTEKHPTVQALRKKIANIEKEVEKVEKEIEETPKEAVLQTVFGKDSPAAQQLEVALAGVQSQVDLATRELGRLEKRRREVQAVLAGYAPVRQQYLDTIRKCDELEDEKALWQKRLTEIQMAFSAEVAKRRTHLEAVQNAEKQFRPSSPKLLYVLGFALAGGLVFGGAIVFLGNSLDRSVTTPQEAAKHFDLPVCGVIGEILTPWQRLRRRARQWVAEPLVALMLVAIIGMASLNIVLWLQYPEEYQQWKTDWPAFIKSNATDYYQRAVQELKQFP